MTLNEHAKKAAEEIQDIAYCPAQDNGATVDIDTAATIIQTYAINPSVNEDRIRCQEKDLKIVQLSLSLDKWRQAVENLVDTLRSHDAISYDCDRSGEKYCNCLDKAIQHAEILLKRC